jgi:enolase-phosphatase E1
MRGILLDIEGTTSSVSFVYDVMFALVRREVARYLHEHWHDASLRQACEQIARDAGHGSLAEWFAAHGATTDERQQAIVGDEVHRLMDADVKATGLKQLQGLIWDDAFRSGELKAHLYDDVPPALRRWREQGIDVRIYSSGSVHAQKLFFGHTIAGDLLPLVNGHYDTITGGKKEAESYRRIAAEFRLPPGDILFVSDVVAELDAARAAGLQTALALRPGNATIAPEHGHRTIESFGEIT